ncbi:bacillus/clostridium ger spore germination protein [Lucifera butyrica]|uniref:Bacillus/clostridium ger spore germination protein n=1 Tax=Lucifera butyrica TaxID=1351585 RepID=A0A498RBL9_9FIRM|nr:spore germination protein [Lucifera butyrica]VBB07662.1 bacillus/clostridium ger spore germination protein [Lucifera butyrica]
MPETLFTKIMDSFHTLLTYAPPDIPAPFVLHETAEPSPPNKVPSSRPVANTLDQLEALLRYAYRLQQLLEQTETVLQSDEWASRLKALKSACLSLEKQKEELEPVLAAYTQGLPRKDALSVSASLEENSRIIRELYQLPDNKDVVLRHFSIGTDPPLKAMMVFIDGLVDNKTQSLGILQPLMLFSNTARKADPADMVHLIMDRLLPNNQVKPATEFESVQDGINGGDTALFIDGTGKALLINTKGWEHRNIDRPLTEQTVRGSQASFSENFRTNTGLIRTMLRSSDLVTDIIKVGARSRVSCAVMYLKSVANPQLVEEVKRRIKNVQTDYLDDSGVLEQFIHDKSLVPFPQTLSTERPDRVTTHLAEGRLAFLVEGSPFAHVLPVSFFTFFHSAEDFSINPVGATFLRLLRYFGALLSLILPGFFIAITYFHQEAIPTELVLAIAATRENVPFPALFEVLMMELAFELIREAGLRIPGMLGSTIGIVGAIILGQAAVSAHIVSPIIVIIVAITGLASSIIPEYRMGLIFRLSRFLVLFTCAIFGLVGLASSLLLGTVILCQHKSYGVPYMVPIAPKTQPSLDVVVRGPVSRQEERPDALNTIDPTSQPPLSKKWLKQKPAEEEDKHEI